MTFQEVISVRFWLEKIKALGKLNFYSEIFVGLVDIRHKNCFLFVCLKGQGIFCFWFFS
jgi:hypothetical protein